MLLGHPYRLHLELGALILKTCIQIHMICRLPPAAPQIDVSVSNPAWEALGDIETINTDVAKNCIDIGNSSGFCLWPWIWRSVVFLPMMMWFMYLHREYKDKDKLTNVLTFTSLYDEGSPARIRSAFILLLIRFERECVEQDNFFYGTYQAFDLSRRITFIRVRSSDRL